MEIDEVFVKDNPGLCRCCLSEGCYKDLASDYAWMGETEIYADMLLECFDISISQQAEGPNGATRLICEVCITRLRDACNFKKQVIESEKKFIDMIGRGEFKQKEYPKTVLKVELEIPYSDQVEETEAEYLDEDGFNDNDDDEVLANLATTSRQQVTLVKRTRGRPKTTTTAKTTTAKTKVKVKTERKAKAVKEETKKSKGGSLKREISENSTRLLQIRKNIMFVLHYGNVMPFRWHSQGLKCFYCRKSFPTTESLKDHMAYKHFDEDIEKFVLKKVVSKDVPVKIDVGEIMCRICDDPVTSLDELIEHLLSKHDVEYDSTYPSVVPFKLDSLNCVLCGIKREDTPSLILHVLKTHIEHPFVCHLCGSTFTHNAKLMHHISHNHLGYRCNLCEKRFTAYSKLQRHRELFHGHTNSYDCALCSEKCSNYYQLKVHMSKEHNVAKYKLKCDVCGKEFITKGSLSLHVKLKHNEMSYKCDLCEYKSGIKWLVTLHRKTHSKVKDYECNLCQKKFGRSSNLSAHMRVHTGNVGRVCRFCRQGFVDRVVLKDHVTKVHDLSNYS